MRGRCGSLKSVLQVPSAQVWGWHSQSPRSTITSSLWKVLVSLNALSRPSVLEGGKETEYRKVSMEEMEARADQKF